MRKPKIRSYSCGLAVAAIGLGLYTYSVRQIVAPLALFGAVFMFLALMALGAFLVWCASERLAIWASPAWRNVFSRFRRFVTAYARY